MGKLKEYLTDYEGNLLIDEYEVYQKGYRQGYADAINRMNTDKDVNETNQDRRTIRGRIQKDLRHL